MTDTNDTNRRETILLNRFQFCHVSDRNSGDVVLHEGPARVQLTSNQELVGTFDKIRLSERQWCIVRNPFDVASDDIREGEREQRIGPQVFSLHPGEILERQHTLVESDKTGVSHEVVLTDNEALLVRARLDCPHPLEEGKTLAAGEELLVKGPRRIIPHKDLEVIELRKAVSLSENEGVFIQDDDTGKVRLVRGPADFFREHNESFWGKPLTTDERQALGLEAQRIDGETRALSGAARPRRNEHDAVIVELEDREVLCLFDQGGQRVEFGPKTVFLGAHERPKVLVLSGGVPVRPSVLKVAKLHLGPDFIRDRLEVRTHDNAILELAVVFRWQFEVNEEDPGRLFRLKDPIGFAAQALSSEIREVAAQHGFEAFHSGAASIIKSALFGTSDKRVFAENGFAVLGVDVESVVPVDPEIAAKLTATIKTTVDIVTRRQQQEAELESERRLIDGRARNEEARQGLLDLQIANARKEKVEAARTEAEALALKAKAEAETILTRAEAEAKADRKRRQVEVDLKRKEAEDAANVERQKLGDAAEAEIRSVEGRVQALQGEGAKVLAAIEAARVFRATDKVILPSNSKLVAGLESLVTVSGD